MEHHRDLRQKFAFVLRDLERDPFQPHLKFHSLTGKLKGMQAVSITHSYRITLTVLVTEKEIILLDIGSHDQVYR
ncbi:type II toxin-antitoxin system RelE/ParE family toxin [Geotalea toluenoxydans]|uniref:type II toxin-antitoxin system RelE/ParE family toxin n=1 Tax=Geotalea toluenoxydans TaxID=421624 RepID=UPI001FB2F80E|nr:plasmid stabilization protein [Geotalea toluenoxydans]